MTFHINIKNDLDEVIERCKSYGIKVGLAINPDDDVNIIDPYIDKIENMLYVQNIE